MSWFVRDRSRDLNLSKIGTMCRLLARAEIRGCPFFPGAKRSRAGHGGRQRRKQAPPGMELTRRCHLAMRNCRAPSATSPAFRVSAPDRPPSGSSDQAVTGLARSKAQGWHGPKRGLAARVGQLVAGAPAVGFSRDSAVANQCCHRISGEFPIMIVSGTIARTAYGVIDPNQGCPGENFRWARIAFADFWWKSRPAITRLKTRPSGSVSAKHPRSAGSRPRDRGCDARHSPCYACFSAAWVEPHRTRSHWRHQPILADRNPGRRE